MAGFDLQAHRGGMGLTVENTLAAFRTALAEGVTTLECDVNVSSDGVPMVTHDRQVLATKCRGEYVGAFVSQLTYAQLRTLDCGSLTQPAFPSQRAVPGEPMPTFAEALALAAEHPDARINVEAKFDVLHPDEVAPRETFVEAVLGAIDGSGLRDRVTVQSFDWEVLRLVGEAEPAIHRYVLTAADYLQVGHAGASPWLGGLDIDGVAGHHKLATAAADAGFAAISPAHGWPFLSGPHDPSFRMFVTEQLVAAAHDRGLVVVPYTVDDLGVLEALVEAGVDGVITNYPDRVRTEVERRGIEIAGLTTRLPQQRARQ